MNYRIDFRRKIRSLEDVEMTLQTENLLNLIAQKLGEKPLLYPSGWTLDSEVVQDVAGMTGKEVLEKHIYLRYPEAEISCWDCWNENEPRVMQDLE